MGALLVFFFWLLIFVLVFIFAGFISGAIPFKPRKYRVCHTNKDGNTFWVEKRNWFFCRWKKVLNTEARGGDIIGNLKTFRSGWEAERWAENQIILDEREKVLKGKTKVIVYSKV